MYNEYFGFKESPFSIAPDPRYLYMSEHHREALAHLIFGFNSDGGFVLLTGEVGTGKTTVCRCLLEQVPDNSAIAFILNPKLTVEELLATICDEFRICYPKGNSSVKVFIDLINAYLMDAHASGRKAILIIDEAQNLTTDVLEQLRLLTNLETNRCKLLQIILLGQPELRDKLSRPELLQLSQRIVARYHLGPLPRKEIGAYISHRLSVAGLNRQLFSDSTISKLYSLTDGIPRLINVICDRALLGTYSQGKDSVSTSLIRKAAKEVFGDAGSGLHNKPRYTPASVLSILLAVIIAAVLTAIYIDTPQTPGVGDTAIALDAGGPLVSETPMFDRLQWPEDQIMEISKETAFQSLMDRWGIVYSFKENGSACDFAATYGLRCKFNRGNFRSLIFLNRPVVLKLYDQKGQFFYGTLRELGNETAVLTLGTETLTVSVRDIESHWFGDYTLLWKTPPGYKDVISPGNRDATVAWLNKQLAVIRGETEQPVDNNIYNNDMVNQVKEFQTAEGLVSDGIVGIQTLIRINTAVGNQSPLLITTQKET